MFEPPGGWQPFDLAATLGLAGAEATPPDLYWAWAVATGWRSFVVGQHPVAFIAELQPDADLARGIASAGFTIEVPPTYLQTPHRHFTGRVAQDDLPRLATLGWLKRWELGAAVQSSTAETAVAAGTAEPAAAAPPPLLAGPVMAVIDNEAAFLHEAFAGPGGASRVRRLWDQGRAPAAASPGWQPVFGLGYGREWAPDSTVARTAHASTDEAAAYRGWQMLVAPPGHDDTGPLRPWTHGTHVLHMAAGWPDPAAPTLAERDAAAQADLVFVGLPAVTAVDATAGSLQVHVLDGLRYILDCVAADARLVVNLSYGCQAGPHDGSSLLERAIDELLEQRPDNFAIVLGAGNSRTLETHAQAQVSAAAPMALVWDVPPGDTTDSHLELWYPAAAATELSVRVTAPDGSVSRVLPAGQADVLHDTTGNVVAALLHVAQVANGDDAMVLLALHATQRAAGVVTAPAGPWTLQVRSTGPAAVPVHAWIETDEAGSASSAAPGAHGRLLGPVAETGTLSGYATGRHSLVAGGMRASDDTDAPYASLGPVRSGLRQAASPNVRVVCEEDEASLGFRAAATQSAESVRMNGTSVAAPVLARLLLNHLAASPAAVQRDGWPAVIAALRAAPDGRLERVPTSAPAAGAAATHAASPPAHSGRSPGLSSAG